MKLFWKIFGAAFISFVVVVLFFSFVILRKQISNAENHIIEENRVVGTLISKAVELGYLESNWPFESLRKLSERDDFLFWWIVREDGIIHLADKAPFMGTSAHDYFPHISNIEEERGIFLNRDQNYGIFIKPLEIGIKKWSFWIGFSMRELSEIKKKIVFMDIAVSLSVLLVLGSVLHFTIRHLLRPIKDLTLSTAIIGKGDLTHRVKTESDGELGRLIRSFNQMAGELEKRTFELTIVNGHLRQEIEERKRVEEALCKSEERFRTLFEHSREAIYITAQDGKIVNFNQSMLEMFGYSREEIMEVKAQEMYVNPDDRNRFQQQIEQKGFVRDYEVRLRKKNGTEMDCLITAIVRRDASGSILEYQGILRDITERKQQEQQLVHAATHDLLTGLPNRMFFNQLLNKGLALAHRSQKKLVVMLFDLDRFKEVNDTLGHSLGDQLLKNVGNRLRVLLRESDIVARIGGDEFLLLLQEITMMEDSAKIAQKVLEAVREPIVFDNYELHITTSIGIAVYPDDGGDAETIVKNADIAMYQAKEKGRDNYQYFNLIMNSKTLE
jgi:diguanylate cyclase (GGDEF)-like protein/PAS domain S-box-containing protein